MGVDSHFKMKEEKDHDAKENKSHINNSLKSWGSNMKKFECHTNSQNKRNVHIVEMKTSINSHQNLCANPIFSPTSKNMNVAPIVFYICWSMGMHH